MAWALVIGWVSVSPTTLEQRIERLERIVHELQGKPHREPGADDWRATIGVFSGDPRAKEIIDEALRLRENDRQQRIP
jgi:hypothetical protein